MTVVDWKPVAKGLATMVPGLYRLVARPRGGATDSAAYCYSVWLKHMTLLWHNGLRQMPATVAELGPGESLGIGLAALLSGVARFYALDVAAYSNAEKNLCVLDGLVSLFSNRARNPIEGWPDFSDHLDAGGFPSHILSDDVLARTLAPERLAAIREAITRPDRSSQVAIRYFVPWTSARAIERSSVDLIYSQSVLEHVADLPKTLARCHDWLKAGGWMSHQIDFASHGITSQWNGHWQYPEWLWRIVVGGRPYLINRHPASAQVRMLESAGFEVGVQMRQYCPDGMRKDQLSDEWRSIPDADLECCGMYVQARKR